MPSITAYGNSGTSGYTNNGSWAATDQPNAGHWYLKGPMDYIAWWSWALNLPANATIQSASWVPSNTTAQTPENATWYLYDTNAAQGGAVGTLFAGGYSGGSVDISRVNAYKTGTMWARYQNSLNGSGSNTSAYVQIGVASTYITVNYITNTPASTAIVSPAGTVGSPTVVTTATPNLIASFTDPDADPAIQTWYELWNDVTNTLVSSGYGANFAGPIAAAQRTFVPPALTNGVRYRWRSWTQDQVGGNAYSPTWGYFTVNLNQTVSPGLADVAYVTSDAFTRANGNLAGTKTDAAVAVGGRRGFPWVAASTTPANDATNVQVVGNQIKRTVAEPANAMVQKAVEFGAVGFDIVAMPTGADSVQIHMNADTLNAGAVPANTNRVSLFPDGSVVVSVMAASVQTTIFTSAAGVIAAGDTLQINVARGYVAAYRTRAGVVTLIGGGAATPATGSLHGVRFNGTAGVATILDNFFLAEVGTIVSREHVGTPSVVPPPITVGPAAIASGEAFGNATLQRTITTLPGGIGSAEAVGTPQLYQAFLISEVTIPSAEAFGNPTVIPGSIAVITAGIASGENVPVPVVQRMITVAPGSIASGELVPNPTIQRLINLAVSSIASAEAFGNATVQARITLTPVGIASAQALGAPVVQALIRVIPGGVGSQEAFGVAFIDLGPVYLLVGGIASAEALGIPNVVPPSFVWIHAELSDISLLMVDTPEIELVKNGGWIEVIQVEEQIELEENN